MATKIKEITAEEYREMRWRARNRAVEMDPDNPALHFSAAFSPISGGNGRTKFVARLCRAANFELNHFSASIPCDSPDFPGVVVTCLIQVNDEEFYVCRHKVGNCPWKE